MLVSLHQVKHVVDNARCLTSTRTVRPRLSSSTVGLNNSETRDAGLFPDLPSGRMMEAALTAVRQKKEIVHIRLRPRVGAVPR